MVSSLDLSLIDDYTGGVNMPLASQALYVARANAEGNNIEYAEATDVITADGTLASALAPLLRGVGLTVDANGKLALRTRARQVQFKDYFLGGNTTSGSIGSLGWNLLGSGTPAIARQNASFASNTSSRIQLSTSTSTNDRTVLALGETETRQVARPSGINFVQCTWSFDSVLTNKRAFFGLSSNFATEPSAMADGLGIYYDSAISGNYLIISRSASSGSPVNTGVAVPSNTAELITIYQPAAGTFQFYSGNTLLGSISSGVATTTGMGFGLRLETLSAASKTLNVGYVGLDITGAGAYDDDTFLEA